MEQNEKRPGEPARTDELTSIERFYENFRRVPLKYLDLFIGVGAAALVAGVAVGVLGR